MALASLVARAPTGQAAEVGPAPAAAGADAAAGPWPEPRPGPASGRHASGILRLRHAWRIRVRARAMEHWSSGVTEYWNSEPIPSITPILHYSSAPAPIAAPIVLVHWRRRWQLLAACWCRPAHCGACNSRGFPAVPSGTNRPWPWEPQLPPRSPWLGFL